MQGRGLSPAMFEEAKNSPAHPSSCIRPRPYRFRQKTALGVWGEKPAPYMPPFESWITFIRLVLILASFISRHIVAPLPSEKSGEMPVNLQPEAGTRLLRFVGDRL